jgi:hypothetical protein
MSQRDKSTTTPPDVRHSRATVDPVKTIAKHNGWALVIASVPLSLLGLLVGLQESPVLALVVMPLVFCGVLTIGIAAIYWGSH